MAAYAGDMHLHVAREFTWLLGAEPGMKGRTRLGKWRERSFYASLGVFTV